MPQIHRICHVGNKPQQIIVDKGFSVIFNECLLLQFPLSSKEGKAPSWWEDLDYRIDSIIEDDPAKQKDGATYGQAMLAITLMRESDNHAQRVGTHAAAFLTGKVARNQLCGIGSLFS